MNVLFDTNVVLDALLDREPWSEAAVYFFAVSRRALWSGNSEPLR